MHVTQHHLHIQEPIGVGLYATAAVLSAVLLAHICLAQCSPLLQAGLTALHYAAWQGSVDAVELLLEKMLLLLLLLLPCC